ncbi:nitroreductase family protein [Malaciobacter marinus]|jgi:nitroreductase|uniref:Nitroreductase family protein n=2 Tax=Malaciobacter TaxID=2321114 RepID=A0AB36ZXH4_9BACT|nr:nitroreductase family protein [Malaciobacter marinus]PPK61932.1 nitroreductase family protein [Malaciobacter marinus]
MPLGLYKDNSYIKEGDFKTKAGYLCLEQDLGKDSAVTFFLTTKSKNYQAAYQKAGIIGHRLYLIANYLGYGCSGIGAYYDDEVCEFIEDNSMVLYALAIGN